jgi:hypothetical protein
MSVTDHWPATKALSVYNVLVARKTNAFPATRILAFLQKNHLPRYEAADVAEGIAFLKAKGFVDDSGDEVRATHSAGPGKPVKLKRINKDADLALDV